jgi:uncharacterized protein (TIGR03067 family)
MPGMPGSGGDKDKAPEPRPENYMTIVQGLKAVLDRVEKMEEVKNSKSKEKDLAACFTVAADGATFTQLAAGVFPTGAGETAWVKAFKESTLGLLKDCKHAACTLASFDQTSGRVFLAAEMKTRSNATSVERTTRTKLAEGVDALSKDKSVGLKIVLSGARTGFPGMPGGGNFPGMPGGGNFPGMPGGGNFPGMPGGQGGKGPPMPPAGGPGAGGFQPPAGGQGGFQPPGGFPGGFPGGQPGGFPGQPGGNTEDEKKDGTLTLSAQDVLVAVELETTLNTAAYRLLFGYLTAWAPNLRATSDLLARRSWPHELAAATQAHLKDKGAFPPGALPRAASGERGIDWRPDQRLSWAAAVLPYLGPEYNWRFDAAASWNEGNNLRAARRIVPHLLGVPQLQPVALMVKYPGVDGDVAAGYFVGMAGLGLDAAEYTADDAGSAKKRGVFGYDRVTRREDIKDGPEQTIALIMVPPEHQAPWLAGGGSTVRGVSDDPSDNPITPFVCVQHPKLGKKGTLAIMADGKVRFIPADIPAATFRALCTIAGGEKIDKLDEIAPVIDDPTAAERELKAEAPGLPKVPDKTPPPAPVGKGSDQEKMQGTWKAVSATESGQVVPAALLDAARLTVSGNTIAIEIAGTTHRATFTLDTTKNPREIESIEQDGPNRGKKELGIYELSGNQLKICIAKTGSPRPTTFSSTAANKCQLLVLEKASTGPAPAAEWKEYTPASKTFTVKMPGKVTEGKLNAQATTYACVQTNASFLVAVADLSATDAQAGADKVLDTYKGQFTALPGLKITSEQKITLGSHTGREWLVDWPGQGTKKIRAYIAGKQAFTLQAGPVKKENEKDLATFFDSFRIGAK